MKAEYCSDIVGAEAIANEALATASDDPRVQFLLRQAIGRQFSYLGQYAKAEPLLLSALDFTTESLGVVRMNTLLYASQAVGQHDPKRALELAHEAVHLAEQSEWIAQTERIKALGELAVAKWLEEGHAAAFPVVDELAELLVACKADNDAWRNLFVISGHVLGFLAALAQDGRPPEHTADGEDYGIPQRGIYLTVNSERPRLYDETKSCVFYVHMARYSEAVCASQKAVKWATRGLQIVRDTRRAVFLPFLAEHLIADELSNNHIGAAIELAIESSRALATASRMRMMRDDAILDRAVDVQKEFEKAGEELQRKADNIGFELGILPAVMRICTVAVEDREAASGLAGELAGLCNVQGAKTVIPEVYSKVEQLLTAFSKGQRGFDERLGPQAGLEEHEWNLLRTVGYLLEASSAEVQLERAVQFHVAVLPVVRGGCLLRFRPLYRRIAIDLVQHYWTKAFVRERFRFRSPAFVEEELTEAQRAPVGSRIQRILKTVVTGLGLRIPADQRHWLGDEPPAHGDNQR